MRRFAGVVGIARQRDALQLALEIAEGYGWSFDNARFDWPTFRQAKDVEIARLSGIYTANLGKAGVDLIHGRAVLKDAHTVEILGKNQTITAESLAQIAGNYDPENHPAPVVIGHPETDAPAFGWVDQLYVEGDVLKATIKDAAPEFVDMVKAGRYKRVSISLFLPNLVYGG